MIVRNDEGEARCQQCGSDKCSYVDQECDGCGWQYRGGPVKFDHHREWPGESIPIPPPEND